MTLRCKEIVVHELSISDFIFVALLIEEIDDYAHIGRGGPKFIVGY